jgi:GNAT superfamily N-acetyltransferase
MNNEETFIFSDLHLARRLEKAEAHINAEMVETRARLSPEIGASWIEVAGAHALFDGAASPLTQTFGLGLFASPTPDEMATIEEFFRERDAPVFHEISPLADTTLLGLLNERGYQPHEFTSVMFRSLRRDDSQTARHDGRIAVRLVESDEHELWAQTAAEGWSEFKEYADQILELSRVSAQRAGALSFLAEHDGHAVATGALSICEGVALLAGASTIPSGRKQGAQSALLDARLSYAVEHGCDIAMICAAPGSASQRNAERQGFRIAYTRTKWHLAKSLDAAKS